MKTILDNSNIVEGYPGITLPLTTSFIESAYHGVFRGSVVRLTASHDIAAKLDGNLSHMVINHQGRIYYNLNNWYAVISLFPFSNKVTQVWRQMLGINQNDHTINPVHLSVLQKLRLVGIVLHNSASIPAEMIQLEALFASVMAEFYTTDLTKLTNEELAALYRKLENQLLDAWEVTLANDMYAFIYCWLAEKRLKDALRYIAKLSDLESMRPVRSLIKLTQQAVQDGIIEDLKRARTSKEAQAYINQGTPFSSDLRNYIAEYGDRYLEELKLESATYRTNPELLLARIVGYADDITDLKRYLKTSDLRMPKTSILSRNYITKAKLGISNRETSRLNRTRLYGMVRAIFLQLGANLSKQNVIDDQHDIFYLTISEVFDIDPISVRDTITDRKNEYKVYAKFTPKARIIIDGAEIQVDEPQNPGSDFIGVPVSAGKVVGEVLIINDPKTAPSTKGKILVTKTTDPGWVFLLVQARGIISEKGSLLSHTAIIARELSIPAVVGVERATEKLRSGQRVSLDGNTGKIEVLDA
jgi:phosphohistidine swiveling domain-containing protein